MRGGGAVKLGGDLSQWGLRVVGLRMAGWVSWLPPGVCGVELCGCVRGCGGFTSWTERRYGACRGKVAECGVCCVVFGMA